MAGWISSNQIKRMVNGPPKNMMAPMNSSYDDFGLAFIPGMGVGLFSSDRPGGIGGDDIYAFESLVKVEGKVLGWRCRN